VVSQEHFHDLLRESTLEIGENDSDTNICNSIFVVDIWDIDTDDVLMVWGLIRR
jgi:hypothetical protein